MSKLSKLEILVETKNHYSKHPELRGVKYNDNIQVTCMYNGDKKGQHCGVGRCLMGKYKKQGLNLSGNQSDVSSLPKINNVVSLDKMLSPKYRGHSTKFWEKLQLFHDRNDNWGENGLTDEGKRQFMNLESDIHGNIV